MRMLILPAVVAVLLGLVACGDDGIKSRLTTVETDYFDELYRYSPTFASAQGQHRFDGRLDDVSELAIGRRTDEVSRMLARVMAITNQELSLEDETDGALIEYTLRAELAQWDDQQTWRRSPLFYADIPFQLIHRLVHRPYAPPSERARALVITINEVAAVMAAMRGNVTEAPEPMVRAGIDRCGQLLALLEDYLPSWGNEAAGVDMSLADSFRGSLPGAIESVEESVLWLKGQLPRSRGISSALGPEGFVLRLLLDSHLKMPLSELLALAEQNLAVDSKAFHEAANEVAPGRPPAEALRALEPIDDDKLIQAASQELAEIRAFLNQANLVAMPSELGEEQAAAQYRVQESPRYLKTPLTPYHPSLPSLEGNDARHAFWLLGPPIEEWPAGIQASYRRQLSPESLRLAAIADLLPGRFLHELNRLRYPTRIGRLLSSRVTRDGWAHYVEQMMLDEGYRRGDAKQRLAAAHRALVRDCRFVTSVRVHTQDMSLDEAAILFEERAFLPAETARLEARDIACDPLRLAPSLGKAIILQLREEYRRNQGSNYSLRGFHDAFLAQSALPLPLMRPRLLATEEATD